MTNSYENHSTTYEPISPGGGRMVPGKFLALGIVLMLAVGYGFFFLRQGRLTLTSMLPQHATFEPRPVEPAPGPLGPEEQATIDIFKNASPSVVFITSIAMGRNFMTLQPLEIPRGTGSGFIWDENGHIVTNFHVIADADKVSVTLQDQTTVKARIIGADPSHDLAVLKVESGGSTIRPVKLGTSANLQVGQRVLAIGNPFGLDSTLTTGIISALGRSIRGEERGGRLIHGVIQTDAAINPGNSGGPLLDSFGRLIGINTAIVSPSGANAGIGFAVPVDTINKIVPQLIAKGKISMAGMGVVMFSDEFLDRYRIKGALIAQVTPGSAADKAGLKGTYQTFEGIVLGDIIIAIDGKEIKNGTDLTDALTDRQVGDKVAVDYLREKKQLRTSVVLQEIQE